MAGDFKKKLMSFIGIEEQEPEQEERYYRDEEPDYRESRHTPSYYSSSRKPAPYNRSAAAKTPYRYGEQRSLSSEMGGRQRQLQERPVDISQIRSSNSAQATRMSVVYLRNFEGVKEIADNLNARNSVVISLERLDAATIRRVLDFIAGLVYITGGSARKVSSSICVVAPRGVDISGNISLQLPGELKGGRY